MGDPTIGIDLGDGSVAITIFFTVAVLLVWLVPTFRPRRWALAGIAHSWRTDGWWGVPVANEPSYDVVDRELRLRRRSALAGLVALAACLPWLWDLQWATHPNGVFVPVAIAGGTGFVVRVALLGREALGERADGRPRVSNLTADRVTDHVPGWWVVGMGVLVLGLTATAWVDLHRFLGGTATWLLLGGCAATILSFGAAAWLVRQPQVAHSPSDLRWNAYRRSLDVVQVLVLGPMLALAALWFPWVNAGSDAPRPWWVWPVPVLAFGLNWWGHRLARTRRRRELDAVDRPEPADAER